MSAFIVSQNHINAICLYAAVNGHLGNGLPNNASVLGMTLWKQNYKSVNYRYGERHKVPDFKYAPGELRMPTPVEFIKLLRCLAYQSCEAPSWPKTKAYRYIRDLVYRASPDIPGYDDVDWAID